jgi:hypothetical protein
LRWLLDLLKIPALVLWAICLSQMLPVGVTDHCFTVWLQSCHINSVLHSYNGSVVNYDNSQLIYIYLNIQLTKTHSLTAVVLDHQVHNWHNNAYLYNTVKCSLKRRLLAMFHVTLVFWDVMPCDDRHTVPEDDCSGSHTHTHTHTHTHGVTSHKTVISIFTGVLTSCLM